MGRSSQLSRPEKSSKSKRSSQSRHGGSGHTAKAASGKHGGTKEAAPPPAAADHRASSGQPLGEIGIAAPALLLSDPRAAAAAPSLLRPHPGGLQFLATPAPAPAPRFGSQLHASSTQQSQGTFPKSIAGAPSEAVDISQLSQSQNSFAASRFGSLPLGQTSFSGHASSSYRSLLGGPSAHYCFGTAPSQMIRAASTAPAAASRHSQEHRGVFGGGGLKQSAGTKPTEPFLPPHLSGVGPGLLPSLLFQPAIKAAPEPGFLPPRPQRYDLASATPPFAATTAPSPSQVSFPSAANRPPVARGPRSRSSHHDQELVAVLETKAKELQESMAEKLEQQLQEGRTALLTLVESKVALLEGKAAEHGKMLDDKAGKIRDLAMETLGRIKGAGEQIVTTAQEASGSMKSFLEDSKARVMNSLFSKIEDRVTKVVKKVVLEHHTGAVALSAPPTEAHTTMTFASKTRVHKVTIPETKIASKRKHKDRMSPLKPLTIVENAHPSFHIGLESRSPPKQGGFAFHSSSMSCITPQDPNKMKRQGIFSQASSSSAAFLKSRDGLLGQQGSQECSERRKVALKKRHKESDPHQGALKKPCSYRRRRFGSSAFQPSDESELGIF